MPTHRKSPYVAPRLHSDEQRIIELHKQTEHKVDLMRRYYGQYPSIIATAGKRGNVNAEHIFLIDAFAGAGAHLTRQTNTSQVPGTAVQACIEARRVQREFPGTTMHVRLIDASAVACKRLSARVKEFTDPKALPERVDVTVVRSECQSRIAPILAETEYGSGQRYCSLWFFDPHGLEIPRSTFAALLRSTRAVEILINLDVGAIYREIGQYESPKATSKMKNDCENCLTDLFSHERWKSAAGASNYAGELDVLARAYAASFSLKFRFGQAYKLRSGDGQERYMIHLTNSKTAASAFAKSYRESQKIGNLKGNALTWADRENIVSTLFYAFKGNTISLDHLATQTLAPLSKAQSRVIVRHACDQGFATYDPTDSTITWNEECTKKPALALDRTKHREPIKDPGKQLKLDL
jgi:three-Cys-motif partner protein